MKMKTRKEGELIPEGASVTENDFSVYLRYRKGDTIAMLRIPKDNFYAYSAYVTQLDKTNG